MMANNIKYILIGNVNTGHVITEFIVVKNPQTQTEAKKVLQRFKEFPDNFSFGERTKVKGNKDGNYYFIVAPPNTFLFCQVEQNYPEKCVYELLDNINNDHIPIMVNEQGELNVAGRQSLKQIIDKYQDEKNVNKISGLQEDVNQIQISMNSNIRKIVNNMDNAKNLQDQSNRIKDLSADYKKNAKDLERVTWWKNFKLTIIIVAAVVLLILIIVLPIILTKK
jgi:vesicle-associated membrane protein 4